MGCLLSEGPAVKPSPCDNDSFMEYGILLLSNQSESMHSNYSLTSVLPLALDRECCETTTALC